MTRMTSLRERKKAQTRCDLADAAFAIVREHGPAALTAEAIADRAGVSRRTFFNYFPSVDSAVAHSVRGLLEELTAALDARPATESIWDTIPVVLTGPEGTVILEQIALLSATREGSPQARHLAQDHVEEFVDWLAGWLTGRLGERADDLYAVTLAASVAAVAEATLRVWTARHRGAVTPESLADYRRLLAESLHLLRAGFDREA
jgi:AcrR family transcriptional regulator